MNMNRRNYLKGAGLAGLGIGSKPLAIGTAAATVSASVAVAQDSTGSQTFNMRGYAAPKLDEVRIGVIGLGSRGSGALKRLIHIEGARITALADEKPEAVEMGIKTIAAHSPNPATYSGSPDEWKKLCERDDVDLVYIVTPWDLHTQQALYAMEQGKHAASELPVAMTLEHCWQLVETSEKTRRHCIILGNQCFGEFELTTLNMARQGFFGELVHGDGAYNRDMRPIKYSKDKLWFTERDIDRIGALYNIHGIGPVAQKMNINSGDSMEYLVSITGKDFSAGVAMKAKAAEDPFWQPYVGREFNGNCTTCLVRTRLGRTMMFSYDHFSARPSTKMHVINGTEAMAMMDPPPSRLYTSEKRRWLNDAEYAEVMEHYRPEILKRIGGLSEKVGGKSGYDHGGQDTLMDWRIIDCLRNGLPMEQDVYDAAAWSALVELTSISSRNRGQSVDVPDFTRGAWKTNPLMMDLDLKTGGTTKLI
jgi:predicted dehydrogenase